MNGNGKIKLLQLSKIMEGTGGTMIRGMKDETTAGSNR